MMESSTSILVAAITGIPAVFATVFAFRSSSAANRATVETNRITKTKVDGEAYERSQHIYEKALANAEKELERLQSQVDRVNSQLIEERARLNAQLMQERESSNTLRAQVVELQTQQAIMQRTLAALRRQLHPETDAADE